MGIADYLVKIFYHLKLNCAVFDNCPVPKYLTKKILLCSIANYILAYL